MTVGIGRIGFEGVGIDKPGVGAMDGDTHAPDPTVNLDLPPPFIRSFANITAKSSGEREKKMTDEEIKQEFVRVSPCGQRLEVSVISWNGHSPTSAWVDFGPIPKDAGPVETSQAVERILVSERFFRRCQTCKTLNPVGLMHDANICQGCAERDLGIVY